MSAEQPELVEVAAPRANIQAVEVGERSEFRNLSIDVAFDPYRTPTMSDMFTGRQAQISNWKVLYVYGYRKDLGGKPAAVDVFKSTSRYASNSLTTPQVLIVDSFDIPTVRTSALVGSISAIDLMPLDVFHRSGFAGHSLSRLPGTFGYAMELMFRKSQSEPNPSRQTTPIDLATVAARVVAAVKDLPGPDVYPMPDDGLVLDFVWRHARLSCVLRHSRAHVMFFGKRGIADRTLDGEEFSEAEVAKTLKDFAKRVTRGER